MRPAEDTVSALQSEEIFRLTAAVVGLRLPASLSNFLFYFSSHLGWSVREIETVLPSSPAGGGGAYQELFLVSATLQGFSPAGCPTDRPADC